MVDLKRIYDISANDILDMMSEPHLEDISEIAVDRETYIKRAEGLKFQLVENWCLVYYCSEYDCANQNYYHWLSEFRAYYLNLQKLQIKTKSSKENILRMVFIDTFDFNDMDQIYSIIEDKFYVEGITDPFILQDVSKAFSLNIDSLIKLISTDIKFSEYIKDRFVD